MHHIHLHFGPHQGGQGFGRFGRGHHGEADGRRDGRGRGRENLPPELWQARRDLKAALAAPVESPEERQRVIEILTRATAEILGR